MKKSNLKKLIRKEQTPKTTVLKLKISLQTTVPKSKIRL